MQGVLAFQSLSEFYNEPHRQYHNLGHIDRCLWAFDRAVQVADNPDAIELGLWFHDIIYTVGASDNEWRSAELFQRWSDGDPDLSFRTQVHDLIMATTHRAIPCGHDQRLIVDIDLCGFGLPWDEFVKDSQRIRAEFSGMSDDHYFNNLLKFLELLLNRSSLFVSDYFHLRYEQCARANAQRLAADLRSRGYGL
jgi:predicted metal-dependent HD superfamily phosphohydrolase